MKHVATIALSILLMGSVRAEVIYSNLNSDVSAPIAYGFTQFAQRFTTVSAGTGLHLDLNIVSLSGTPSYSAELWSADGTGTNVGVLLATIGSGSLSSSDRTALTSFDLTYTLDPSTHYFVRLTSSSNFAWALGPSSSTLLNSILRYGMSNLTYTDNSIAGGMKVDVVAAGVPEIAPAGIGSLLAFVTGALALLERRRVKAG